MKRQYNVFRKLHGQSDSRYSLFDTVTAPSSYAAYGQLRDHHLGLQCAGSKRVHNCEVTYYTANGFTYLIRMKAKGTL